MLKAPERIATARLVLRKPALADAERIYVRYAGDPVVTRYLSWRCHESAHDTRAFLRFSDEEWARWPAGPYLIEAVTGELLGSTGLGFESAQEAITGYVLARDAWGKGYATEALRRIQGLGHDLGLKRMSAQCHPDNVASRHVLEKCGFTLQRLQNRAEFPNLLPAVPVEVLSYSFQP
jgi:ribosomal-protein-alanine N-acetyltransferase